MKPQPETLSVVFPGVEVRVPLKEKYVFPENCVVCGKKPAEKEVYQTIMQMGNPNRFATAGWFEINFPICNACSQIQETARRKSQSFFLPSALTGVGTFVLVLLLTRFNIIAALIAGCFLTIIGIIVYSWLVDRKISKEFLNQYQKSECQSGSPGSRSPGSR